jgi:hypothetical protein
MSAVRLLVFLLLLGLAVTFTPLGMAAALLVAAWALICCRRARARVTSTS